MSCASCKKPRRGFCLSGSRKWIQEKSELLTLISLLNQDLQFTAQLFRLFLCFKNASVINLQNLTIMIIANRARFGSFPSHGIFVILICNVFSHFFFFICSEQRKKVMPNQMSKCFCLKTSIMILSVCNVTRFRKGGHCVIIIPY